MLTRLCVYLSLGCLAGLPAAAQALIYTANQNAGTISLIDPETGRVAASPSTGQFTATSLAITPDGGRVYVASGNGGGEGQTGGSIVVLDTATNVILTTLSVNNPFWIALNSTGSRAYFTNSLSDGTGFVSVIDTFTNTVTASIPVGHRPLGIALSPNGDTAYVANATDNTVSVIDALSNTVTATIPVPTFPWGVATTPDGRHVYVSSQGATTVTVIDTSTNTVVQNIPVGEGALGVAINPSGTRAYVAISVTNSVAVIDTTTYSVVATVPVGTYPIGVTVAPLGGQLFVANEQSNSVSIVDTATNTQTAMVSLSAGAFPFGIGSTPTLASATNASQLTGGNAFTGNQTIDGSLAATSFSGDGSNITNVSPANISAGTAAVNITGNAATASSATSAGTAANASNAVNLGGVPAGNYARVDIGNNFNGNQSVTGNIIASGNVSTAGSLAIGGGTPILQYNSATYSITIPSLKPNTCKNLTETLAAAGSGTNDTIALGVPNSFMSAGGFLVFQAWETSANTITIRTCNIDPNGPATSAVTDTIRVDLFRH